jgi:4-hydroxy-3-methylbut-2-enyl diphosphate reductase
MEVIKVSPRGYCYGVVDAIQIVRNAAKNKALPRPIYILGLIVHNRHVVDSLQAEDIITLDGPDRLELLASLHTGTVIFTAHGVSPEVKKRAQERGLTIMDATCPDVTRTHVLVRDLVAKGYHIIYIGKKDHPESEGVVGEAPDRVHLVQNKAQVDAIQLPENTPLAVTNQTTLSQWDTYELLKHIKQRYPQVEIYNEICLATQQRQEACAKAALDVDVVVVVGDSRSNNSNRLVEIVKTRAGKPAYLVDSVNELQPAWFKGKHSVAVTSGSSTPTHLTREVVSWLEAFDPN